MREGRTGECVRGEGSIERECKVREGEIKGVEEESVRNIEGVGRV